MGGKTQKHLIRNSIGLLVAAFVVFGLGSLQTLAQQTGAPGQDTDASNISQLLRISDTDGKQVKSGSFRVGNAGTIDISSTFEVFGDLHGSGSLLVAGSGVCNYTNEGTSILEPSCTFATVGQKYPTFIADVNTNYVGVGTNLAQGKLSVYSAANEFVNGAVYATSSSSHGAWGVAQANGKAGVFGNVVNPNTVAVFGKSIDKYSWGVSGFSDATGVAPAGLFWGNVVVTGGYIQGNASGLYRVSSVIDSSLAASEGGRGLGVWGNKDPITIDPNKTTQITNTLGFPFKSGERIRSFTVFIRTKDSGNYRLLTSALPVTATMTSSALTFVNTSSTTYEAKVFAYIENTLSITVEHATSDGGVYAVGNTQPVMYESSGLYELKATVGPGQSPTFNWQFDTASPKGQLCYKQSEGVAVNCVPPNTGVITAETIYYKFPSTYVGNTWQDPIKVTWGGSSGTYNVTRTFTLRVIDMQVPATPIVAQYNAGIGSVSRVTIPVTYKTPTGTAAVTSLTFQPVIPEGEVARGVEEVDSNGGYRAPGIALDSTNLGSRGVTAPVKIFPTTNPEVYKQVMVYLVPEVNLQTTFPSGAQSGQNTSTTAAEKPLTVAVSLAGYNGAPAAHTLACTGCTSGTSLPSSFQKTAAELGAHNISVAWTPSSGYPSGLQVVTSKTLYVSSLSASNVSGAVNTNITIPVTINFGTNTSQILTELASQYYRLNTTVPVAVADYSLNPHVKGGADRITAITSPSNNNVTNITFNSTSCNAGTQFTVSVRNPSDYRDEKNILITVTGCSTNTCTNCSGCPSSPKFCDSCCNNIVIGTTKDTGGAN